MFRRTALHFGAACLLPALAGVLVGCGINFNHIFGGGSSSTALVGPKLSPIEVAESIRLIVPEQRPPGAAATELPDPTTQPAQPVTLEAARNEWTNFAVRLTEIPAEGDWALRLRPFICKSAPSGPMIGGEAIEAFQILSVPLDVNRASYVRHTGRAVSAMSMPRALVPLKLDRRFLDIIPLTTLRDPAAPADPKRHAVGSADLWLDVHVPADVPAGEYEAAIDVVPLPAADQTEAKDLGVSWSVPMHLTVHNFVIPADRHLEILSQVSLDSLVKHYPNDFETITPRLINREDKKYAGTMKVIDSLVALAQHHRLGVIVPCVQPTVKWPANAQPVVDWSDFDSIVGPWFSGRAFPDKTPVAYWPLPEPDGLANYDVSSRTRYWAQAAAHFDQNDWLDKTSVSISKVPDRRANAMDSLDMSSEAAQLLAAHKRLRVTLPLEDDQVQFAPGAGPLIDPNDTRRLLTACPGLVFAPPTQQLPPGTVEPNHWLRTDLPGLVPYVGAGGDERDVRVWAWLAFLRKAKFVLWTSALPSLTNASTPADPSELIWFYPGSWFGSDEPVPTIQLKWLRRAQQDYECLWLAEQRGEIINVIQMARLITKPVKIPAGENPDPAYTLMTGTTDPAVWADARKLLVKTILLREPGVEPDQNKQNELYIQTLQWQRPQERPLLMGRATQWGWSAGPNGKGWLALRLGLDVYNASEVTPAGQLQWTLPLPSGWEVKPAPVAVPELATYEVRRVTLDGLFNINRISRGAHDAMEMNLTIDDPVALRHSPLKVVAPIAPCRRREGRSSLDGKLDDWSDSEIIQDGPMVRMLSRPLVQQQTLQYASGPAKVYSGFAAEKFYVAFSLQGVSKSVESARNFVDFQARRAWGEDLCEILVQPIYDDNSSGPVLHVVCKPNGTSWVERKLDSRFNADPWESFEGAGIRYVAGVAETKWSGEVEIPWKALSDARHGQPRLLRFNFAQHRAENGESTSWAGPIDFGRDESFTGLLFLPPGMDDAVLNDYPNRSSFDRR